MTQANCPRLVVAGTASGVGKTSLALGIVRALRAAGLRVQTFKVGPDFLDPTYLARASGRTCYNLDAWMTSPEYVRRLFARAAADADLAVIEGVMGLFDGASPDALEGSTAEIASLLGAPILLVVNAHGSRPQPGGDRQGLCGVRAGVVGRRGDRQSIGFVASCGVVERGPGLGRCRRCWARRCAGRCPRCKAGTWAWRPPTKPFWTRRRSTPWPTRAKNISTCRGCWRSPLGGDIAGLRAVPLSLRERAGVRGLHRDRAVRNLRQASPHPNPLPKGEGDLESAICKTPANVSDHSSRRVRLGIARDEAFHFYYPDNLESLAAAGAEWAEFSPLADRRLPEDLDGLYFGGGYPEVHAARLAANRSLLDDVRRFASSGRAVYAECGGLMYLGREIRTLDGARQTMAGSCPWKPPCSPG